MYVRNAWYVAAWDHEIGRHLLRRILLDEPVVLYRTAAGRPVALEDRCCHRQAPLSMGKLVGDIVQCPYHGLQFDAAGACVKVPSQERIPPSAKVKSYPVLEKHHWIWVWMGEPAKADPALIEDFHFLDDPKWRYGGNYLHVDANYLLLVENLLDTTHLPFLHPTTLGTDAFARSEFEVKRDGDRITVSRYLMNELPAPFHKQMGAFPDGMKVDRWQVTHFGPPSFVKLDIGSAPVGTPVRQGERGAGVNMWNLNAITPETDKTAHYFFAQAYNFKLDQRWVGDMLAKQITDIFMDDMAMVKAQQVNIDLRPAPAPVNLGQDKAWVAMRQIVERLAREEQQSAKAA
jgi:vanillate O-demethylase monooxygenase subunit